MARPALLKNPASSMSTVSEPVSFSALRERLQRDERLNVVFLGGSLTWGAQATDPQLTSYRARLGARMQAEFPRARPHFWDAAIGGTTSQLAVFRLERDVLARKPGLVFLDFSVNDNPADPERLAAYEAIVRRLLRAGAAVVPVILPVKKDVLPGAPERAIDGAHRSIGSAYGVPVTDVVSFVRERVARGLADPDELWCVPGDVTHPGDAAYSLYADAVWQCFEAALRQGVVSSIPVAMLHPATYTTATRVRLSSLGRLPGGWSVGAPVRTGAAYDFLMSRWLDDVAVATVRDDHSNPAPLVLRIRGETVLLFGQATTKSGHYEVQVDDRPAEVVHAGQTATQGNGPHVRIVVAGLAPAPTEHRLVIRPLLAPGDELRLESVCVAGRDAAVALW